jgi:polysaccharide pyruvyl transferase WcaK-like protein
VDYRIGLIGYFGWGNFGDELFFQQWQTVLGEDRTFRVNDLLQKPYTTRPAVDVAGGADAFLIGGGDLIRTESISSLYWNKAWTSRPLVISGIGVAQETERRRSDVVPRLRQFMADAHILSLSARDAESQAWIEEQLCPPVEVRLVPDLAYAAVSRLKPAVGRPDDACTVGVVLNKRVTDRDVEILAALLRAEEAGQLKLRLMVLATGQQRDQEIELLRQYGHESRAEVFSGVPEMIAAIAGLDVLYSAKFHGLVVASALGIPSRSLRTTSKATGLAKRLGLPQMTSGVNPAVVPARSALGPEAIQLAEVAPGLNALAAAEVEHVTRIFRGALSHASL